MKEKDTLTFAERLTDVLGYPGTDPAVITLRVGTDGQLIVGVALKVGMGEVIRGSDTIPASKATPSRILSAAESIHATLTGAIAIFAANTPGFEEESDAS